MNSSFKTAYKQPSIRFHQTWSPALVGTSLRLLMAGKLQQAALLADAVLGDDRVQPTLSNRVNGMLGLTMQFEPDTESRRAKKVADALEQDFWDMFPEKALAELHRYGLLVGACAAELVWYERRGRMLPRLKVWHPSLLDYDDNEDVWRLQLTGQQIVLTPGDGKWLLYTPYGDRRPWTNSLVRAVALPWLAKHFAVKDWQGYSEVHGSPTKVGKVPAGAKKEDKDRFLDELFDLGSNAAISVPDGYSYELVEASSQTSDGFDKLISWANTAVAISVLGQNLTTEVGGGSLAAAKVHDAVRSDLLESDTESLATFLHEQALRHWTEFNFGDSELTPWALWGSDPPEDTKTTAETTNTAATALSTIMATAKTYGLAVDVRELAERLNIPLLAKGAKPDYLLDTEDGEDEPEPTEPDGGGDPDANEDNPEVDDVGGDPSQAQAASLRLASGDALAVAQGAVDGQVYTDALAADTARESLPVFAEFVDEVRAIIGQASDYDDLRTRLAEFYAGRDPAAFASVLQRAMTMSNFAGRYAVVEDM
ncbi:MAG: DUF935 family protein [Deinococcota bacterium]